ncbi:hypothetical protein IQ276_008330 [Desmonostoc muscorum LEGE 12446]|uniref:Uncharacterized protein n=1 Tax=Desmonostoc muscorum LEGE 12446 TaxID=1828758 RepID=A0A8J7CXD6_DESMC|nr:hypothetical protein [Desmonostoc muscorum]MCF2146456.1 hypothetical protein [Desmonostoc muscorum LEGE 12446]
MQSNLTHKPWAIVCTTETCKPEPFARYFNRFDAEQQLIFLRKKVPDAHFVLVFEE